MKLHTFAKIFYFVIISIALFGSSPILSQSNSKVDNSEEFVVKIVSSNNPVKIVEFKYAYANGDSLNYPELKYQIIKTPFEGKYSAKTFEGIVQSVNRESEIKVIVGMLSKGSASYNSSASGRIIRVYRTPKGYGVATF